MLSTTDNAEHREAPRRLRFGASTSRRSDREPAAYRVLVDSLFSSPSSFLISNLVGVLLPAFCHYVTGQARFAYLAAAIGVMAVARIVTLIRYRQVRHRLLSISDLRRWDRVFSLSATAFSLLLGVVALVAVADTDSVPCHIMTIGGALVFASGYVARNAARPNFVLAQLACFCIPTGAGLWISGAPFYGPIAIFIVFFFVANVAIVFSLNRNLLELAAATKQSTTLAASLQRQNTTLDTALNSMTHGLCLLSPDLALEICNKRFLELFRLAAGDVVAGVQLDDLMAGSVRAQLLTPQSADDLRDLCARATQSGRPAEREVMTETGQIFVASAELTDDGGILMLTEDASARKAAAAQIERMAHCDTLTGLHNRFRFGQALKAALESGCARDRKLALLYVDLDDFKLVNDTLGHEAGDTLLVKVAHRLQQIVETGGVVARFGGDEFLLLITVEDGDAALAFGRLVIAALAPPFDIDGKPIFAAASVGIALAPEHGREPSDIMRSADMALYAAKAEGRNRAVLYTHEISEVLSHRREMEVDLREATRTGRLFLHYQPIVDARTDHVRSYEALMRWDHPHKGMISPVDFIPIAERTGLIVQMGAWALRQACMDARGWPRHISVAVNVSAFQFREPGNLIEAVKDALLISGLSPSRLELEVTESLLIADQDATLDAIRVLRRLGVRFSLDDFGSGYSSLGYLARYPFSKVKIDRSFAEHLTSDSPSRSIIEVVCQLANKLGMRVVVEGIETESQRREIVALGAEQAQGFLFGRPQSLANLRLERQDAA